MSGNRLSSSHQVVAVAIILIGGTLSILAAIEAPADTPAMGRIPLLALAGAAVTILVAAYVLLEGRRRLAVERLMAERTRELHAASEKLKAIIESSPLATGTTDGEGRITVWNKAAERLFGFTAEEVLGSRYPLAPPGREEAHAAIAARIWKGEDIHGLEMPVRHKDGRVLEGSISAAAFHDPAGAAMGIVFTIDDITERNRQAASERELAERLRAVVETAVDAIIMIDERGTIQMFNPAAEGLFGYRADEAIGHNVKILMPASYAGAHDTYLESYRRTGARKIIGIGRAVEGKRRDGSTFPMHLAVGEIKREGGSSFVGIVHDLTEYKAEEARLRRIQTLLTGIVESSHEAIIGETPDGRVTTWNRAAEDIFGYAAEEMIGRHISILAVPGREDEMAALLARVVRGERITHHETQRRHRNGAVLDVVISMAPLYDDRGHVIGASKISRDVTAAKRAEKEIRHQEELYRATFDQTPVGIAMIDRDFRYVYANETLARFSGMPATRIIGSRVAEIVPDLWPVLEPVFRRVVENGESFRDQETVSRLQSGGEIRHWQASYQPVRVFGEIVGLSVTVADITERKAAENALRRSKEHLARVQQVAGIASAEIDLRTREGYWSEEVYQMFGLEPGSVDPISENFFARIHPEDEALIRGAAERGLRGERVDPFEFRVKGLDGAIRWYYRQSEFVRDEQGTPIRYIATYLDITERKVAELKRAELERQLRTVQRIDAIGQLTGGIAHDFNNLLGIILGNLDFLEETFPEDAEEREMVRHAVQAATRGAELTRQLLAFARQQPLTPKLTDMRAALESTARLLHRTLGESISLELRLSDGLWQVLIDIAQLESAIVNLAVNARDAMPSGGRLLIEGRNVTMDAAAVELNPEASPGDYVNIAVSDNGKGMPPEVAAHVFEPFFTTKGERGTGLGLSMVHGFVKQSGGYCRVYSEVDRGTTIHIYLPRARGDRPVQDEGAVRPYSPIRGDELILVVEDNPGLRGIAVRQLESLGYRTLAAGNASEAIAILKGGAPVDLLFTDVVLPGGTDGRSLALEAARVRPAIKVLFTSGFTEIAASAVMADDFTSNLLSKPYRMDQLARRIRAALDARG